VREPGDDSYLSAETQITPPKEGIRGTEQLGRESRNAADSAQVLAVRTTCGCRGPWSRGIGAGRDDNLTHGFDIRWISDPTEPDMDTCFDPWVKPEFYPKSGGHGLGYYLIPAGYPLISEIDP
jgi:hypothetical protein